jgi:cysteine-rich repeat protein
MSIRSRGSSVALVTLMLVAMACTAEPKAAPEKLCTPGSYSFCRCVDRQEGAKLCTEDAQSYGACEPCQSATNPELRERDDPAPRPTGPVSPPSTKDVDSGTTPTASCGDGLVQEGEDCDDKNTDATDGCDARTCKLSGVKPAASNSCPGLEVHVWGGTHKPTLFATTTGSGLRTMTPACANGTPTSGATAPDRIFKVVTHKAGTMTVSVTETNFNAFVYVSTTCSLDANVAIECSNGANGIGDETLSFEVVDHSTYYVFVDGTGTGTTVPNSGDFRVTFSIP